jgi:hypothetical protein
MEDLMFGQRGCLFNSLLFLVIIFVPVLGHIIETFMILEDDHSPAAKLLWLVVVWLLFPVIGPLLYLLFGQRRHQVAFGRPSYGV